MVRVQDAVRAVVIAVLAIASATWAAGSDPGRWATNEDLRHVRSIADARLSPDGQDVLVQIKDDTADGGRGHLWLIGVNRGGVRQLTYSTVMDRGGGESHGQWFPDGRSIAFIARRGEHTSLYRLPMNGGEAQEIPVQVVPSTIGAAQSTDASNVGANLSSNMASSQPLPATAAARSTRQPTRWSARARLATPSR